ncbi:unnamed protein product [Arabidopsis arenosa]|uniref:RNase H type-1 domain-containing protein n=1 Tax=Arabidopsis arenosa TaxID=38785 RepID=A0A8S1ZFI1_ARAAE|nr:unnamed protein product [Arabidopsis arenosa]
MLVKELLCPTTNQWDPVAIRRHLPQYEDSIRSISTSSLRLQDSLIWLPEKSGLYTTKSGYHLARNSPVLTSTSIHAFNWNKSIWQIKAAPKIKNFLWKASSGALSLGSNLAKRGLMAAWSCKRCGEREDELHLFLDCPFAKSVWDAAPMQVQFSAVRVQNFQSLLTKALQSLSLPPTGLFLSPLAPWLLWNLWKARNYLIFEDRHFSAKDIIIKSLTEAKAWQAAQLSLPKQSTTKAVQGARQENTEAVKCFVDAAWHATTGVCGQGWIIYDPSGNAPLRFSDSQHFVASALTAEALALRNALLTIKNDPRLATITSLEMFSDSQTLISALKSKASSKELKAILLDITCLSESFSSIAFNFIPRLDNVVADSIAKSALLAANSSSSYGV